MVSLSEVPGMGVAEDRVRKAMSFPVGAVSPLWFAFGAAAGAGVAYWWLTRWIKPSNLEAALTLVRSPALEAVETVEIIAESVEAEVDEALEAMAEPQALSAEAEADAAEAKPAAEAIKAEPLAADAPEPTTAIADDLTQIVGIGPKLAVALAERGVTTFAQLAAWSDRDLAEADTALNLKGRAVRDAWVAQAARFAGKVH